MLIFCIVLIAIASVLLVLAVLVQNPKSGMAANFGASNQVMGVRQTADFLEKFTWGAATVVLVLSILATVFVSSHFKNTNASSAASDLELLAPTTEQTVDVPQVALPAAEGTTPAN
ncbi:MAG: preprotein translocase subunit SecG [Alistipes sp.]|nr:preprotein translocase subunit SecG [Alistipes sp.]